MGIQIIDEYQAAGDSQLVFNNNFHLLNNRMCFIDSSKIDLTPFFTTISELSSKLNGFSTVMQNYSGSWRALGSLVYNTSGYWLEPINIMYQNTFTSTANFFDIESWLDATFSTDFHTSQILRVSFLVKNYDPNVLDHTTIANTSIETLDALAASQGQSTKDIQSYLSYLSHINSLISVINYILKTTNVGYTISTESKLDELYNSFSVRNRLVYSSLLPNLSQYNLLLIYSYLEQYKLIQPKMQILRDKNIQLISPSILYTFNTQNIYNTFISSFCFRQFDGKWKYTPDCRIGFCATEKCDDGYDFVDVNTLYKNRRCHLPISYELEICE